MLYLVEIILGALIAGILDTVAGFGGALLLIPVLVLAVGTKDAVLLSALIPLGWNLTRVVLVRDWVKWKAALLFAVGILPGAMLGSYWFDLVDPEILQRAIGALLIIFGGYYVLRLYVELPELKGLKEWTFPVIGLLTGVISAILGAGHGPIQTWALGAASLSPREISATNGLVGGITAVARLIAYAFTGQLHRDLWLPGAIGIVAGSIGAVIGLRFSMRAKDSTLELIVGAAIIIAGIRMLV